MEKPSPQLKILLVEDDDELREVVSSSLQRYGFEVLTAAQGEMAFHKVCEDPRIDLVISDIRMPGMSGMEFLEKLKSEISCPPPVILMTGFSDVIFSVALEAGAHSIITKPFTMDLMVSKIRAAMASIAPIHPGSPVEVTTPHLPAV